MLLLTQVEGEFLLPIGARRKMEALAREAPPKEEKKGRFRHSIAKTRPF